MRPTCWPPHSSHGSGSRHAIVSEPTVDIRYDELAQSAMLYIALRILLSSDRYYTALLLTLLFLFGIHGSMDRLPPGLRTHLFEPRNVPDHGNPLQPGALRRISRSVVSLRRCMDHVYAQNGCTHSAIASSIGCAPISCYAAPFLMHSAGGAPSRRPSYFPPR